MVLALSITVLSRQACFVIRLINSRKPVRRGSIVAHEHEIVGKCFWQTENFLAPATDRPSGPSNAFTEQSAISAYARASINVTTAKVLTNSNDYIRRYE